MRPVATQSRFTTPRLGNVFWPIQLLRPFCSDVQLFQAFGSGNQLFQAFGSGNQLFQPLGSAISFSFFSREAKRIGSIGKLPIGLNAEGVGRVSMVERV